MTSWAFCSDEDIAVAAPSDFAVLTPFDQAIARGKDGSIDPSSPWSLTSASTDFGAAGVSAGNVVQIAGPKPPFHPPVECFGVSTVAGTTVVLKRRGADPGVGLPPCPGTLVSSVCFSVLTFLPQIQRASADLERRFGVSDFIVGRRVSDLFDPTELRDATVYATLAALYLDASRGSSDMRVGQPDVWGTKAKRYSDMLAELVSRVEVHWRLGVDGVEPSTPSRLCMRISR